MNLADDRNDLLGALNAASDRTGLPVRQLEKDFWVTAVLRAYAIALRGRFLFKGGTSLSKGWKVISRFSEDIDLTCRHHLALSRRHLSVAATGEPLRSNGSDNEDGIELGAHGEGGHTSPELSTDSRRGRVGV